MRLPYVAALAALVIIINAGVSVGIVQLTSPSGAQGPQGEQGPPGPVATADANTMLCTAAMNSFAIDTGARAFWDDQIEKYCP